MIDPTLKAAVTRAARDMRLAEFNLSQELLEHDLTLLSEEDLAWLERQANFGMKFSYDLGMNAFLNERWRREEALRTAEQKQLIEEHNRLVEAQEVEEDAL
jgi:hypothetical protein